ncbi:solute carrier family 39 (zinc transporter), member 1/2/3, partial [Lecanoromycetidae sp. Uapishka_2]
MSAVQAIANVVVREAYGTAAATSAAAATTSKPICFGDNSFDGRTGLRVSAIFVILIGSLFGAAFPVYAARHRGVGVPDWAFFIAKYFGSGVILLAPANDALTNPCLTGPITDYDWAEGIALMTIFIIFFVELMAMRFATFGHTHDQDEEEQKANTMDENIQQIRNSRSGSNSQRHTPGEDHLSHTREHREHDADTGVGSPAPDLFTPSPIKDKTQHGVEDYAAQMTAIFILEFGVIFHSIFVGLTLAVAGSEFNILYIVLVFHQTFEGLGLGSRLAATPWPKSKRWTPYFFALGYAFSTPIAIAVGLGVKNTYLPGSQTALIANGVFDSISAGILIYTGLVELMAHEFMFSTVMRRARLRVVMRLMALLGKWA